MNRIISSFSLLLFMISMLGLSIPAQALTLKVATLAPAGTNWMKQMKLGADAIKKRTSGRVKIKFYPGGVMGNDQSVHRKIRINQLQGGAFSSSGLANIDSAIQVYSLPMLFKNFDEVDYVRQRMDDEVKSHMVANGFRILGISEGGFARILSSKSLANMSDIKDSKVWIPEGDQLVLDTFETMGITPIALPMSDVFTGLQTGLIETIASTSTGAIAFQWHSKISHMVDIPVLYVIGVLAVNEASFSKISPDDQKVVLDEMNQVFAIMDKTNRDDNISATEALKTQGILVNLPDANEIQHWQDLSDKSIQKMIANGRIDQKVLDQVLKLLAEYRAQHRS